MNAPAISHAPARLAALRDAHGGASILVCGCGESLNLLPLPLPPGVITIGVNDVGLRFDPDYLVVVNPKSQFSAERFRHIARSRARTILTQENNDLPVQHPNIVRFRLGTYGGTDLSDENVLHYTQNSPYVALCLAVRLGATRIGLIGVDFTDNHFFGATGRHPLAPRLARIDAEYAALGRACATRGIEVVNLSPVSRLRAFPKMPPVEFLQENRTAPPRAGTALSGVKVVHVSLTNCAGAFWNLHRMLGRYTGVSSRVVTASTVTNNRQFPRDLLLTETAQVQKALVEADVIHFHNNLDPQSPHVAAFLNAIANKPAILQFHSEPAVLAGYFPGRDPRARKDLPTLVVAQKQARFFPRATPVPNAVDIHHPLLASGCGTRLTRPLHVVYTPTDTRDYPRDRNGCQGKGYRQTAAILQDLSRAGVLAATVRTGLTWEQVVSLRREADAVIDECVTGGYHLTSLETMAQGRIAVAWLDQETRRLICELTGSSDGELPWCSTHVDDLGRTLRELAADGGAEQWRADARAWVERYWHPDFIVGKYLDAYRSALDGHRSKRQTARSPATAPKSKQGGAKPVQPDPDVAVDYAIRGSSSPKRSEDFPQVVRLRRSLLELRGTFAAAPVHILGNGPSLPSVDISLLGRRTLIGTNSSPLLTETLGRPADFYCVTDRRFLADGRCREIACAAAASVRVFAGYCSGFLDDRDINYVRISGGDGMSADIESGFFHCCSVVLFAAQLAMWLGFRDMFFHGCDLDYSQGRFATDHTQRPHDEGIYPRVARNFCLLADALTRQGGSLTVVGPSRLAGGPGEAPIRGLSFVQPAELERALSGS